MLDINQDFLKEEIAKLEKGYVESMISLIKVPVFIKRINEELETVKDETKIKALKDAIETNLFSKKGHEESLVSYEEIITEARKLLK